MSFYTITRNGKTRAYVRIGFGRLGISLRVL